LEAAAETAQRLPPESKKAEKKQRPGTKTDIYKTKQRMGKTKNAKK
jgi:hypothetical protein